MHEQCVQNKELRNLSKGETSGGWGGGSVGGVGGVTPPPPPPKSDGQGKGYSCMAKCPQIG